jgi:hypothetical protein
MSKDAILEIEFYDDPGDKLDTPAAAWLELSRLRSTELTGWICADYFCLLYDKVMYNLGASPPAAMLAGVVETALSHSITKETDVLNGENYSMVFVERQRVPRKHIKASFHVSVDKAGGINRRVTAKFSGGEEGFYAPMGVIAFLQYIIDSLTSVELEEFDRHCRSTVMPLEAAFLQLFEKIHALLKFEETKPGKIDLIKGITLQAWTLASIYNVKRTFSEAFADLTLSQARELFKILGCFHLVEFITEKIGHSKHEIILSKADIEKERFEELIKWYFDFTPKDEALYQRASSWLKSYWDYDDEGKGEEREALLSLANYHAEFYNELNTQKNRTPPKFTVEGFNSFSDTLQKNSELQFKEFLDLCKIGFETKSLLVVKTG